MSKISELPDFLKKDLLRQLPVDRILDALSDPRKITVREVVNVVYPRAGGITRAEEFLTFAPSKPLFEFYYTDMDFLDKNPDDIIKPHALELNYMDCLEILRMHYEQSTTIR